MNRQEAKQRSLQAVLTVVMLLLLQIFNGVDWNCLLMGYRGNCDADCRSEHRMETTCQPDMSTLLALEWMSVTADSDSFFSVLDLKRNSMKSDIREQSFLATEWNPGIPPEEPVPQRC